MKPDPYLARLLAGQEPHGTSTTLHYWRWPIGLHFARRWRVTVHGIRDGVLHGSGPFQPAVRTMLWIGPLGLEFGWGRQRIEDWRWRRNLRRGEHR